ncbi:MAG: zf-HC2 domain-containing protein [Planctomycetia bacterium]|nr:zf-HC2 domain-containing protein [Planctomycetia bacterium]
MNCTEAKKLLPAMALGDLEGAEREALVEHLKGCEACRVDRAHLEKTLRIAEKLPAPAEPSATRRARVVAAMAASAADEPRSAAPRARSGWRFGLAAAVLLAVFGTWGVATGRIGFAAPAYELKAEDVRGEALLMRADGSAWEPLQPGTTIRMGDRVLTNGGRVWFRSGAKDLIVLADGSQLMINRSDLSAPSVMLVYGELWAEVTPRDKARLRFESAEREGSVEVVGTRFHLEYR